MNATPSILVLLLATASLLAGCAAPVTYAPGCPAYTGDLITIDGQRYTWDKFTDTVRVDDDGNVVDPFPGYPREGRIQREGQALRFLDASGALVAVRHLHEAAGKTYLLTPEGWQQVDSGAAPEDCALVAQPPADGG